jgi:heme/copper-type cytochrome/quinol oxidase subunit 2
MRDVNARANLHTSPIRNDALAKLVWIILPLLMLAMIAVPSLGLSIVQPDAAKSALTVRVIGKQWFWSYAYPDYGNLAFDSLMVADKDLRAGQPRLLAVDREMVSPWAAMAGFWRAHLIPIKFPLARASNSETRGFDGHHPVRGRT